MSGLGTHLVVAGASWDDAVRRGGYMPPDRLIAQVAVDGHLDRVLIVNPMRSAPVVTVRRMLGEHRAALPQVRPHREQYTPKRLRVHDPVDIRALRHAERRHSARIARRAARLGHSLPVLISTDPFLCAFGDLTWAGPVTYFAWDDWATHPHLRRWSDAYAAAYSALRERHIRVAAVSEVILSRIDPRGPHRCIPNGVAGDEFRSPGPPPRWFTALPHPRAVYVGALGHRLDVGVVRSVSDRLSDGSVVLVGPIDEPEVLEPLRDVPNVHLHDAVGRAEIVALQHASDVCLLPHRRTPLTEAMSPLKIYEYLAVGRPVVATDLPGIRGISPRVELISDPTKFADAVSRALEAGSVPETTRLDFLRAHTWERRLEDLLAFASAAP